jgi:hypothetical protein
MLSSFERRLNMMKIIAAAALAASIALPAQAHGNFPPFTNLLLKADLATEPGMADWQEQISKAGAKALVYVDWHLQNFTKSELFKDLVPPNGGDDEACAALAAKTGKLKLSGLVNTQDNHQLARLELDLDHLPAFTLIDCEPVIGAGATGLRIRGFFYAADHKIETADETGLYPLAVEPSRLPAGFFSH